MTLSKEDYARHDGLGLAALVANKDVTPDELLDCALAGVEAVNPKLNAVLNVIEDKARAEIKAGLPDGPFRGVPFMIKELVCHAAGVPSQGGSRLGIGVTFGHDTELMTRFRKAGVVTMATTQTPEMGYNPTTETIAFGPTRNPWDTGRSPGGSSGGSGAVVAARIVPIAHANDGGGSIRIPAAHNGLFGIKPTRSRVPAGPDSDLPLLGLACEHIVSRSVRDSAVMLDAVAGPDIGAPSYPPAPSSPYARDPGTPPGRLRIAVTSKTVAGTPVHPECVAAVASTAKLLADLGHEVVEDSFTFDWEAYLKATHTVWVAGTSFFIDGYAGLSGRTPGPDTLEAITVKIYEEGKRIAAGEIMHALSVFNHITRSVAQFYTKYDVVVTPTVADPPWTLGTVNQNDPDMSPADWTRQVFTWCPFTSLYNTTGQPSMSVPLHWTPDGLPVGVQFTGRFADETTLLRLAGQLEAARPWADRMPPVHI